MKFRKYQHIERFGTTEVSQIEFGECFIFPKIDGTNASVWLDDGEICAGSRQRQLSIEADNAGFYAWVKDNENIHGYLAANPEHRLFGEWLVPHSLKTYRQDAWRRFYVFDVAVDDGEDMAYLHYDYYKPFLDLHGVDYIPPLSIIRNSSYDQLAGQLEKNIFLVEDGKGYGEGIVIKNYYFKNRFGRTTWAKIVTSEFKEKHAKEMGWDKIEGAKMIEEGIADEYTTMALCEKVLAKVSIEHDGFSSRYIPQLLNTIYYDVIHENAWQIVKENKNPIINFKTLQYFVFAQAKSRLPQIFGV